MKYLFVFFTLAIILVGCSKEGSHMGKDNVTVYDIDYTRNDTYFWDEYFEYSHHVVLETNDESLFKEITKLIIKNNRIHILCGSMNKVIIFDIEGNFIGSFCHYGEGPGEYLSAVDININNDDNIEALDKLLSNINIYTLMGEFIGTKKAIAADAFLRVDENCYIFNRNNFRGQIDETQPFNFLCMQSDSIFIKDLPYVQPMAGRVFRYGEGNSLIYPYNGGISVPHNDTLYTFDIENYKLNRSLVFNFRIKRPDNYMSPKQIEDYLRRSYSGEIPSSLYGLQMLGDYIFGIFNYEKKVKHVLISTVDGKSTVSFPVLGKDRIPIIPISHTSDQIKDNFIITVLPSFFVKYNKTIQKNSFLSIIEKKLENEECNPSLIFYKLKNTPIHIEMGND